MLSKEEVFEALTTWNYWDSPLPETVSRPVYEKEIAVVSIFLCEIIKSHFFKKWQVFPYFS